MQRSFFTEFGQSDLGTTKIAQASQFAGQKGELIKMLNLSVPDKYACPVLVSLRTEYAVDVATGASLIGNPLVGLLQWGVGGGENQVEFDIPAPRLPALLFPTTPPNQPTNNIGNGVQVYVAGSHISLYVRHDGNLAPLSQSAQPGGNPANDHIGNLFNAKIIAHVQPAVGSGRPPIERTIVVAGGIVFPVPAATPFLPPGPIVVSIPPFAKSVRFQRQPFGTPLRAVFADNAGTTYRTVDIAVNDEGPIPVDSKAQEMRVFNMGAINIDNLQTVFDVTPS